ncbi:MAG TPA: oligopeptide transporter, OPT family [Candidatus Krumholzibacteria bacterium]|nr:oligopeptide transporter, OPT family [Candidatus Krumholzibacteria bacterium]
MSDQTPGGSAYQPFVPESMSMKELTLRAVIPGLFMCLILGAANAYLGLRAGQTIAATYPAAVISMVILRFRKGSILEENIARTAGSIGESVAAGAIFTLPAFVIAGVWPSFGPKDAYWKSTALMLVGGVLGVLFCSLIRRVMVEDRTLPFPESVAASQIHKAGQRGAEAAKYLFYNMLFGAVVFFTGASSLFAADKPFVIKLGELGLSKVKLGATAASPAVSAGGITRISAPTVSPAYLGVGYIIGPELAALSFSGGVLAWGLMVPLLVFLMGPNLQSLLPSGADAVAWGGMTTKVWLFIVRPIAVGGMLVGTVYTLYRRRESIFGGLGRALHELRAKPADLMKVGRTERYMSSKTVFTLIGVMFVLMAALYVYMTHLVIGSLLAAVVMIIAGFFFATVSGYLVGLIGSSNNPISGLTLSTLIIAALLMVAMGVSGQSGVAAVLGVAAVVCVSSAVAGELLQDFKVGWILGGTPRSIQIVELVAVIAASLLMYFPLMVLHEGNIKMGGIGFGDARLPAPQAGLMAALASGIVGGDMPWALIIIGVLLGFAMILLRVKSPMLVAVGMYLPLETTSAIFVGGCIRWLMDRMADKRGFNAAQRTRAENVGILAASGLIAGEALTGLVTATFAWLEKPLPVIFQSPSYLAGLAVMALIAFILIRVPLANAGAADEPAPPAAIM